MEIRSDELVSFGQWFGTAAQFFLIAVPVLIGLAVFAAYLVAVIRRGPVEGFYKVAQVIGTAVSRDWPAISPRRVIALTRITVQEAIRRRVLIAFGIFAVILLFGGWFLDTKSDNPAHIYLSFVLGTTNFLVVALALFLATFSIPADVKRKTIFTVVTKPVRAGEIVLGRVLGFSIVISTLLVVMCFMSYMFVVRGIDHEHGANADNLVEMEPENDTEESPGWEGTTTTNSHHHHSVTIYRDGWGKTDKTMGHWHEITASEASGDSAPTEITVGPPKGVLQARVPMYGKLHFLDRDGNPTQKGISVGKEWGYRTYIEGRTMAAAIWTFEDITEQNFLKISDASDETETEYLPLAMTLSVFRTYKGNIEEGVRGIITVSSTNPRKPLQCEPISFESQEYETQHVLIPRKLRPVGADGTTGREIDLLDDLIHDGQLEIWVQCDDPAQYFGMARADVYIEGKDASFAWNFIKAYIGIWLQMIVVVCLGVTFSTFLSTPIAILATLGTVVLGNFRDFVLSLWSGEAYGGGPLESMIRMVRQDNVVKPLEFGTGDFGVKIVKAIDYVLLTIMNSLAAVLPDFSKLGRATEYVAYNFNFYGDLLARQCLTTLIYVTALVIVGYFFLKTREIAA